MEAFGKDGQHAPMVAPTYDIDRREVGQWIEALALDVGLEVNHAGSRNDLANGDLGRINHQGNILSG